MKRENVFNILIDSSIALLMKIIDYLNITNAVKPMSGFREETLTQPARSLAEESDYLSINEWMRGQG